MTTTTFVTNDETVGAARGTALFVTAIIGPGILTLPALAAGEAGPASLIVLASLLLLSAPIAFSFAALHRVVPGAHGVAGYAAAAFGGTVGRLVAAWFRYGVPVGIPALGLIGGEYVAEATGTGEVTAVLVAAATCVTAVAVNLRGRAPGGAATVTLALALVLLVVATALLAAPHARAENFTPFAPRGWAAVAASALLLTWVLTGWEAVTNFTHVLRDPRRTLPRVTTATLVVVALLYAAVAVPEIAVLGPTAGGSEAPVAALLRVAVGPAGAAVAALVAVVIATSNTVAWVASLAQVRDVHLTDATGSSTVGRGPTLVVPVVIMATSLAAVASTPLSTTHLVSICAGAQVPVYLTGLAAGVRLLTTGSMSWWLAVLATLAVSTLLLSAGAYLLAPALIAVLAVTGRRPRRRRAAAPGR